MHESQKQAVSQNVTFARIRVQVEMDSDAYAMIFGHICNSSFGEIFFLFNFGSTDISLQVASFSNIQIFQISLYLPENLTCCTDQPTYQKSNGIFTDKRQQKNIALVRKVVNKKAIGKSKLLINKYIKQ